MRQRHKIVSSRSSPPAQDAVTAVLAASQGTRTVHVAGRRRAGFGERREGGSLHAEGQTGDMPLIGSFRIAGKRHSASQDDRGVGCGPSSRFGFGYHTHGSQSS
jgi:hypothetical protein